MLHSRPASPNSFITHPLYALNNSTSTMQDDLYRSAFGLGKQQPPGSSSDHSRHPSNGSSHSSFSLGASTALSTPNDSPPLDFLNSPAAGGIAKLGGGGGRLAHETGPIRRMHRQDASASPYPSQPPLRSNSFSGSDSHRSSSSEAEDIGALFPSYGNQQQQLQQQGQGQLGQQQLGGHSHHEYAAMYAHTNRSANALALGSIDPSANPAASFQRMSINTNSDQALEQLAANVRAATTTSASDRAKHIFVQAWLNANYAPYQDGNVPRQGLYNSYRRVCDEYRIPHVNTATLGKAIRLCFPAIKTRRLGVRGNSKYHYCGIRPSTASEAEWLQDFINRTNNTRTTGNTSSSGARPTSQSGRSSSANEDSPEDDDDEDGGNESSHSHLSSSHGHGHGHGMTSSGLPHLSLSRGPGGGGGGGGRRSPVYFSMTDDKTPTVGGFNAAQAQAIHGGHPHHGSGSSGPSYTSLRRRAADGIVASNVSAYNTRGSSGASTSSNGNGMVGTLRPGQSVRMLRGFPDVEEAIGGGQGPLPSDPTSSLLVPSSDPSDPSSSASASASSTPSLSSSTSTSASTTSPPGTSTSASNSNTGASTSAFATTAREVWRWFEEHLDLLIEAIRAFRFDTYEVQVRQFWGGLSGEHKEIVHAPAVAGLMAKADALVYDEILEILRSQLLVSIPPHVLTGLRQLADKMEKLLLGALEGYGTTFVEPKVELGARFGHLVLRFLDIYQVTQALSSVMANPKQLQDMARSWRDVDFESVRNQAALVCNCRHEDLHALLEVEFVAVLDGLQHSQEPVRDVIVWADAVCERLIGVHTAGAVAHAQQQPGAEERVTMSSRSLLIRWGYVTSQIMRDLTIRSDPAFGAFQILKLFMDDWIALNVLRNVALSTNSVAASVEPTMHNQFLALSPGGSQFAPQHQQHPSQSHHTHNSGHHPTHINTNNGGHTMHQHSAMMAHTPTTASMIAAMGDPFGTSSLLGGAGSTSMGASNSSSGTFAFEPLSFGSHMDSGVGMGVGSGAFDFGGHGMSMDVGAHSHQGPSGHGDDSEMSSPGEGDDGLVKVEGTA